MSSPCRCTTLHSSLPGSGSDTTNHAASPCVTRNSCYSCSLQVVNLLLIYVFAYLISESYNTKRHACSMHGHTNYSVQMSLVYNSIMQTIKLLKVYD